MVTLVNARLELMYQMTGYIRLVSSHINVQINACEHSSLAFSNEMFCHDSFIFNLMLFHDSDS
jgi:hypothetical protein